MRTQHRRLLATFALGLALWVSTAGLTTAQPPEIRTQLPEDIGAPRAILMPPVPPALDFAPRVSNAACDPISRVPNFFGDFVARPSRAFVNQRAVSTTTTTTLTFLGLPSDVAGGVGRPNTFYAPLNTVGPGGPYRILTDVTGFGVAGSPDISILNENAELTAKIKASFPGATFAGGIAPLEPPFAVIFDYLNPATATVPGLVALINLPNPAGGGLAGRNKYFDDGSPLPRDRVFFDYNRVADFNGLGTRFDINRYVFGAEKTFLGGWGSVEVRVPFAGTANSDQNGGQGLDVNNTEFGNVGLLVKGTLFRTANFIATAGMGVSMPTADDARLLFGGRSILEIRNNAWLLQPIVGAAWAPNDRFYVQSGLQLDFDPTGNPVYVRSPGGEFSQRGVLSDQTYLYLSGAVGYWVYQCDSGYLSAVSLQGELHYNRTISARDFVQTGSVLVADLNSNLDVLNATAGVNFVLRERATFSLAASLPVSGERLYDWNLMARFNWRFGNVAR